MVAEAEADAEDLVAEVESEDTERHIALFEPDAESRQPFCDRMAAPACRSPRSNRPRSCWN